MEKKNEFKPFIPADKIVPEFTVTSVILGVILAVIFGGANAYLGLRVGMTVSASMTFVNDIGLYLIFHVYKFLKLLRNNEKIGRASCRERV